MFVLFCGFFILPYAARPQAIILTQAFFSHSMKDSLFFSCCRVLPAFEVSKRLLVSEFSSVNNWLLSLRVILFGEIVFFV